MQPLPTLDCVTPIVMACAALVARQLLHVLASPTRPPHDGTDGAMGSGALLGPVLASLPPNADNLPLTRPALTTLRERERLAPHDPARGSHPPHQLCL